MSLTFRPLALLIISVLSGCVPETDLHTQQTDVFQDNQHESETVGFPAALPGRIPLLLDTRSGTSTLGWSFAQQGLVPAKDADLVLTSSDCGARGRWVMLEGTGTVELCTFEEQDTIVGICAPDLEIGGSDVWMEPGDRLVVRIGDRDHTLALLDRTETPFDWYEADDLSFFVDLHHVD